MSKIIGYSAFFLMLVNPLVVLSQECSNDIPSSTSHLQDNADGTVSDSKTGLVWKKCSEGQNWNSGTNGCDGSVNNNYNWQSALQQAKNVNNASGGENFGKVDWRVPNIKELFSIVELKCKEPSINILVFPSATMMAWGWSSSLYISDGRYARTVYFINGSDDHKKKSDTSYNFVRLVRSE